MKRNSTFDVIVVGGINTDYLIRGEKVPAPGQTVEGDVFQQAPVTCLPLPPRFAPSPVPVPEEILTGRGEALKKGPSKD